MPLDLEEEDPLAFDASTALVPGLPDLPAPAAADPRDLTPEGIAEIAEGLKNDHGILAAEEFLKECKKHGLLTWETSRRVSPLLRGMVFPERVETRTTPGEPLRVPDPVPVPPEPLRRCTVCQRERAVSCFHKTGRSRRRGECRDCSALVKELTEQGQPPDEARRKAAQIRDLGTTPDLPGLETPLIPPRVRGPEGPVHPGEVDLRAAIRGFAALCRNLGAAFTAYAEDLERFNSSAPVTGTIQETDDAR